MSLTPTTTTQAHVHWHSRIGTLGASPLLEAYRATFAEIDTLAVQRHLMTPAEFRDVCLDDRVRKYLHRTAGFVDGMSVMTNDLDAWPLVSPRYFERHFPELYERKAIWYIGFVMATEGAPSSVFPSLVAAMLEPIRESRGMGVLDFCAYNVDRGLGRASTAIIKRLEPSVMPVPIDVQTFVAYTFDWPV